MKISQASFPKYLVSIVDPFKSLGVKCLTELSAVYDNGRIISLTSRQIQK